MKSIGSTNEGGSGSGVAAFVIRMWAAKSCFSPALVVVVRERRYGRRNNMLCRFSKPLAFTKTEVGGYKCLIHTKSTKKINPNVQEMSPRASK